MKNRTMFDFELLFGDHMAKVSNQAKLYYIKLNFYANNGFVANPMTVLDEMGFDKSVFFELVRNDELLVLEGRCEVFITSYFVHNHFSPKSWLKSPFAQYWKGKLFTKPNGVATFNPQGIEQGDQLEKEIASVIPPEKTEPENKVDVAGWDAMFQEQPKKEPKADKDNDYPF